MSALGHALLLFPDRIARRVEDAHRMGVIDKVPNEWQLGLIVLRMWHRLIFRADTVGTSPEGTIRDTARARLFANRAARLPALLATRAVAPLDYTGLASSTDRIIGHLLKAHHDGSDFVYDLEILSCHPGGLEKLVERTRAVVAGRDPRSDFYRDLVVYDDYHEDLLATAEQVLHSGIDRSPEDLEDPDRSFLAMIRWAASQPATPRSWLRVQLGLEHGGSTLPAPVRPLLGATARDLAARFESGGRVDPQSLADADFMGVSLGMPPWFERITWKKFAKCFRRQTEGVSGFNVRCEQNGLDNPWQPRMRGGKPVVFGPFDAVDDGRSTTLDYARRSSGPMSMVRDPLVTLDGDPDLLLGRLVVSAAGKNLPTPSYFVLMRSDTPLAAGAEI